MIESAFQNLKITINLKHRNLSLKLNLTTEKDLIGLLYPN